MGLMAGRLHGVVKKHEGVMLPQGTEMTWCLDRTALAKQPPGQTTQSPQWSLTNLNNE